MKFTGSIKFRLSLWFLLFMVLVVLFFSAFSYFMLSRNLFYRTYSPLYLTSTVPINPQGLIVNDAVVIEPVNIKAQTYRLIGAFSIPKDQLQDVVNAADNTTTFMTPSGQFVIDLGQYIPANMTEGLEIWFYGRFSPVDPDSYEILAISQSKSSMIGIMNAYQKVLFIAIPATVLLAGILGYFLVRRMLKPVEEITRAAQGLREKDLTSRIDVRTRDELGKLAGTLNQAFESLQSAFEKERRFTADASHELRTPLAVMQSEASLALDRDRTPGEYQRSLELITHDISRLSSLIHKLQVLARADSGKEQVDFKRVNLTELLDELAEDIRVLCEQKALDFQTDLQPGIFIRGDETKLRELFLNLLDNAVRYTPPEGRITLSLTIADDMAKVTVRDTGRGIPAEHLPHIFERFYRANKTDNNGSGLGLAICRHIAELHQGRIEVESRAEEGSTFTVILPVAS